MSTFTAIFTVLLQQCMGKHVLNRHFKAKILLQVLLLSPISYYYSVNWGCSFFFTNNLYLNQIVCIDMKSSTLWCGSHITQLFTRKNRQQLSVLSTNFVSQPMIYNDSSPKLSCALYLLSHWLRVIASVISSQNKCHTWLQDCKDCISASLRSCLW